MAWLVGYSDWASTSRHDSLAQTTGSEFDAATGGLEDADDPQARGAVGLRCAVLTHRVGELAHDTLERFGLG